MARRSLRGSRCLVTGASSGIGHALARQLAQAGARLLLTARRHARLQELAEELQRQHADVQIVAGDITQEETQASLQATIESSWNGLDVLVNNAGSGAYGPFAAGTSETLRRIVEVNFLAPAELTRRCLPLLRRGVRPIVVNIGSVLGHRAVPWKSEYCAAKFALHGWSDAVRAEWALWGIDVLLVSPSTTSSEFFEQVTVTPGTVRPPGGHRRLRPQSPDEVARQTLRGIQSGRHEIILSWGGRLLVWADRLCPSLVDRWLAARRLPEATDG
ncbi:MAG: SDR family NAD(P)-dependent oxidoreductase [Pirellulales bacterium]